jgi:LytS/YehU family sensor histidine kinase
MTRENASHQLIIGYIIAVISFGVTLFIVKGKFSDKFDIAILVSYCILGTYWGIKITFRFVSSIFFGNNIYYTNIWEAIKGRYSIRFWFYVTLLLSGYFVGVLGGGIYKQIKLMIIKYS